MRVKLFPTIKNKVSNVFAIAFISIFCVTVMLAGEQPNKVGIKSKIEFDKGINACPTITARYL